MGRINIRRGIKNYYSKNKKCYFIFILCIVAGFTGGLLFACGVGGEKSIALSQSIKSALTNLNDKSNLLIYFNLFLKNLRCVAFVFFATVCIYTLPFLFIHIFLWSFSISFTISFVTFYFGRWGFIAVVLLTVTQIAIMLPLGIFLGVTGVDCALHNIKSPRDIRKINKNKFLVFCVIIFFVFNTISFIDLAIISNFIKSISAFI